MCARVISDLFDAATVEMTSSPDIAVADIDCRLPDTRTRCCPPTLERDSETHVSDESRADKPCLLEEICPSSVAQVINSYCRPTKPLSTSAYHVMEMTSSADRPASFECRLKRAYSFHLDGNVFSTSIGNPMPSTSCYLPQSCAWSEPRPGSYDSRTSTNTYNDPCNFRPNTTTTPRSSWIDVTWSGRRSTASNRSLSYATDDVTKPARFTTFRPIEAAVDTPPSDDVIASPTEHKKSPPVNLCRTYRMRRNHVTTGNKSAIADVDAVLRRLRSTMASTRVAKQPRLDSESRRRASNDNETQDSTTKTTTATNVDIREIWRLHDVSDEVEVKDPSPDDACAMFFGVDDAVAASADVSPTLIDRCDRMFESSRRLRVPDKVHLACDITSNRNGSDNDEITTFDGRLSAKSRSNSARSSVDDADRNVTTGSSVTHIASVTDDADSLESSMSLSVTAAVDHSPSSSSTSYSCVDAITTISVENGKNAEVESDVTCSARSYRRLDSGLDTMTSCRSVVAAALICFPDNEDRRGRCTDVGSGLSCSSEDTGSSTSRQDSVGRDRDSLPISLVESSASTSSSSSPLNCPSSMVDSWNYSGAEIRPDVDMDMNRTLLTKHKRESLETV